MIKKILVSQPKPASEKSPYYEIASKYGVEIVFRPFIKVESLSSKEFRQQKISILDHTAVVFTSRHAIDHFFQLCKESRLYFSFLLLDITNKCHSSFLHDQEWGMAFATRPQKQQVNFRTSLNSPSSLSPERRSTVQSRYCLSPHSCTAPLPPPCRLT